MLLLALAQVTTATMTGVVVDARTRQPLANAVVEVTSPPHSSVTDRDGRFRFETIPIGRRELLVSIVGYALAKNEVDLSAAGADVTIPLMEGTAAYNERLIVRGGELAERAAGVAGQQSLNGAELRQLGGMTLDDPLRAVQSLSGAAVSDDFYGTLAVRGNGFRDLNYTLDGVPAAFLLHTIALVHDGGSVTMIISDVLDQASLLRGAYTQRFDPRLGAAVMFTSGEGSRERARFNVTASGTSASLTADGPMGASGRGSWLVSARRSYLDVFLKRVLRNSSQAFGFSDVFGKVVSDLSDRHQVQATVLLGRSRFASDPDRLDDRRDLARAIHVGWMATTAWRYTRPPNVVLTHRLFATGESYDNDNGLNARVAAGRAQESGYRMDVGYAPGTGRFIDAGWSIERLSASRRHVFQVPGWFILGGDDFSSHTTMVGAYAQARVDFGRMTVTPGARVDRFGLTRQSTVSPWLHASWNAASKVRLVGDFGIHHQFPAFEEIVGRRGEARLRPERATHIDVGVEGQVGSATRWQVTAYDREERDVTDLPDVYVRSVEGVLRPQSTTSRFGNRLNETSRGMELLVQRKSIGGLSGWIAYAFGRTRETDRVTGEAFDGDFDQRHTVSVFGRYRISQRTSVNARWRLGTNHPVMGYVDERPDSRFVVGAARNATRLPTYSRVDARIDRAYRWSSRRLTLFGEVANILNRENFRQRPSGVDFRSGEVRQLLQPMFPIVPSIGATLEF